MNLVSSPLSGIQLSWVKSKIKGRHELTANGPILGSLKRVGFWRSASQAEFKGRTWSFQRNGCARTEILEEPGARPVAQFKSNWTGGGTLVFHDGERFQLVTRGFWRPVWSWINDQGRKLLEVVPHTKSVSIIGPESANITGSELVCTASPESAHATGPASGHITGQGDTGGLNSAQSRLPVLIMFSWHQILQTNDDAAAVAAISVAAG